MTTFLQKRIINDFSKAAKTYDDNAALQRIVADNLFQDTQHIWKALPHDSLSLDIGCGTGYFHELLRKNKIYISLAQTDISYEMCKIADQYASPPEYGITHTCLADMHAMPFMGGAFQAIFSSMTMQWSLSLDEMLKEAKRILAPGGSFVFSIVADGSLFQLTKAFSGAGYKAPVHEFLTQEQLQTHIKKAGFKLHNIYSKSNTMFYKDMHILLKTIKAVGARYKGNSGAGLKGRGYLKQVEACYNKEFLCEEGLPLSWNIIYAICEN